MTVGNPVAVVLNANGHAIAAARLSGHMHARRVASVLHRIVNQIAKNHFQDHPPRVRREGSNIECEDVRARLLMLLARNVSSERSAAEAAG